MTYSIGFRAPSHSDILLDYSAELASRSNEDLRYNDPGLKAQTHAGEISDDAIHQLQQTLLRYADNTEALGLWFGEYMTRPNPGTEEFTLDAIDPEDIQSGTHCQLLPHIRAAFKRDGEFANLFICGESFQCSLELAILISDYSTIDASALSEADQSLLLRLAELELLTSSPLADSQENANE